MSSTTWELGTSLKTAFTRQFGVAPTHIARAPGRVNLIGEHTDYNDGFVLPAAIDRAIFVAGRRRADNHVTVQTLDYNGVATFTLNQLKDDSLPSWTRYARGVLWMLREEGHDLGGMDLSIVGNVPGGAGLSSSAAVEVAMFEIASALLEITLTQRQKALLGVEVEHRFVGVMCGVMDQSISALGEDGYALLIDCRSLETTQVPIPPGVTLMVLDTGKRHELADGEYNVRRAQCEEASRLLGIKALRDITPEGLAARIKAQPTLLSEVVARRATHVVEENKRTLAAVEALKNGDLTTMGRLVNESHRSLRDLYEVSVKELDIMADLAQHEAGCYGARMMGGGFGGSVIALVEDAAVRGFAERVGPAYQAASHLKPNIYDAKPGPGSSVISV